MKMTRITPFVVGAFALAVVGCQDATTNPAALDAPLFNFSNGPDSPGKSVVMRFQFNDVFGASDGALELLAFHLEPDAVGPFGCGEAALPVFDIQEINTPAGIARSIAQVIDAPVYIYDFSGFLTALLSGGPPAACVFLEEEWLYQGTHRLTLVGDFSAITDDDFSDATFGWTAHGNVVDPDGARFRYTEHQNVVVKKGTLRWLNETIRVHPTGGH